MSLILDREREKYDAIWQLEEYGAHSPGERMLPIFLDMAGPPPGARILDAGCGSGKGALALTAAGFRVLACDLTETGRIDAARTVPFATACLWQDLAAVDYLARIALDGPIEYAYCCDVLEHIPTALTMLVVSRLLELAPAGVFLSISFEPDVMGVWIGEPLHQTVQPFVWWRDQLRAVGRLAEGRDLLGSGAFLVRPC